MAMKNPYEQPMPAKQSASALPAADDLSLEQEAEPVPPAASASPAGELAASDADAPSTGSPASTPEHPLAVPLAALGQLRAAGMSGANWFFIVAGLSLVNSAIQLAGGNIHFVVGLAVTLIVDVIAAVWGKNDPSMAHVAMGVAIAFDIFITLIVVAFGYFARRGNIIAFIIGMVLYTLDGLIFLAFGDVMSTAFHAYGLFVMWKGLSAFRQAKALEAAIQAAMSEPQQQTSPQPWQQPRA